MAATLIVGQTSAGVNRPVQVNEEGKLQIGGVALDALNLNTDQIEGKQDITNALLTTTAADIAFIKAYTNVTKGSGVVDANTQRVTLATDGPGVQNLTTIASNTSPLSGVTQTSASGKVGLDVNIIAGGGGGGGASAAYNATLPTYTSGSSTVLQTDVNGRLITTGPLTDTQLRASAVPVSASSLPLPAGAATEGGNLATIATESLAIDNKLPALSSGRVPVEAGNVASQTFTYTGTGAVSLNTVLIGPIDCSQFRELTLNVIGLGSGMQLVGQFSPDGTGNWAAYVYQRLTDGNVSSNAISGVQRLAFPVAERFFRVICTVAQTSGTTTLALTASQQAIAKLYQQVSGTVTLSSTNVTPQAAASVQGFSTYHTLISAASTNATLLKAAVGVIGTCLLSNTSASWRYVKFFNLASAPTMGTSTPVLNFPIPPNSTLDISTAFAGLRFATGIAYAITSGSALLDTGAVGAGEVLINITYM